jgi:retron-type reverse transcriptase
MDCIQPLYKLGGTRTGSRWVIDPDVRACFDKIPHEHLLKEVARRIADTGILTLIRRFLKSGIMIERTLVQSSAGTPQGGIASPLLANIYLHRFDEWYSQHYGIPDSKEDARASASLAASPLPRPRAGCRADVRATPTTGYWSYAERKRKPRTSKRHVKHFSGRNWGSSSQTRRPRSPTSKRALTS